MYFTFNLFTTINSILESMSLLLQSTYYLCSDAWNDLQKKHTPEIETCVQLHACIMHNFNNCIIVLYILLVCIQKILKFLTTDTTQGKTYKR